MEIFKSALVPLSYSYQISKSTEILHKFMLFAVILSKNKLTKHPFIVNTKKILQLQQWSSIIKIRIIKSLIQLFQKRDAFSRILLTFCSATILSLESTKSERNKSWVNSAGRTVTGEEKMPFSVIPRQGAEIPRGMYAEPKTLRSGVDNDS